MKITQECDYAIRIVLYLSKKDEEFRVGAKEISDTQAIPLRFAVKILRKLMMANILTSFKGVNGGYLLCKKPKDITLLEVVEVIDGPIWVNKCLSDDGACNKGNECECSVHAYLGELRTILRAKLDEINFETLSL